MSTDLAAAVRDALEVDPEEYQAEAEADAEVVKSAMREGVFDNHQSIVGLEYEFYAVADGRWASEDAPYTLMRVPRRLLDLVGFEKELGLHNAEMTVSPQPFSAHGLDAQSAEVRARLEAALDCTAAEGVRLVSDGLWTIPPAGETTRGYLADSIESEGVHIATNMSDSVRYHAMANGPGMPEDLTLSAPNVSLSARTVMPESLITSMQPHYQMSHAADLPTHFNYAIRIAGPLLALAVNSPFFPPDLYDETSPGEILATSWHENRIAVFESVLNTDEAEKVRFPRDLETIEQAVDRVAADPTILPMPVGNGTDRFDDRFATLRRKHGTYWRWVRPVFDGPTRSEANARIEFRPLPAQPTVHDTIAFGATFAGLMQSLPQRHHPVIDQDWSVAEENFYAAMRDGIDADLRWIANDGQETADTDAIYDDLLAHAVDGLTSAGCSNAQAERYVAPLRERVATRETPAAWKRQHVRERLDDGADLSTAITEMQRTYIEKQTGTLIDGAFADW